MKDLFIFEMANNHQGCVAHGKNIIRYCSELTRKYNLNACIKFQLRDLKTFVAKSALNSNLKYVDRFLSTELDLNQFSELTLFARECGLKVMGTVFDEESISSFNSLNLDYLKIASCSIDDYPLLEELSKIDRPTFLSTGGASFSDISKAISVLKKDCKKLTLLHCVSLYPTPFEKLNLHAIRDLKNNFKNFRIGFSSHELPNEIRSIQIAKMLGAQVFEKHVALETDEISKNKYSVNPAELEDWLKSYSDILKSFTENSIENKEFEKIELKKLSRGIHIEDGKEVIKFPWNPEIKHVSELYSTEDSFNRNVITPIQECVFKLGIKLENTKSLEASFHYGEEQFKNFGAFLITNFKSDSYLKKQILMIKGQEHPEHLHPDRSELITVLNGQIECLFDREKVVLKEGQTFLIKKNMKHKFYALEDSLIEEFSYLEESLIKNSIYTDKKIEELNKQDRKRTLTYINGIISHEL